MEQWCGRESGINVVRGGVSGRGMSGDVSGCGMGNDVRGLRIILCVVRGE